MQDTSLVAISTQLDEISSGSCRRAVAATPMGSTVSSCVLKSLLSWLLQCHVTHWAAKKESPYLQIVEGISDWAHGCVSRYAGVWVKLWMGEDMSGSGSADTALPQSAWAKWLTQLMYVVLFFVYFTYWILRSLYWRVLYSSIFYILHIDIIVVYWITS